MITRFYKILYKDSETVYVGVTTQTLKQRFLQHIRTKELNPDVYSIIEFDSITHPIIDSLEKYYEERVKVATLEQKYIKEELDKGFKLLNISDGGEWNTHIYNKLLKENFLQKYGSYDKYEEYIKHIRQLKGLLHHWIRKYTDNKTKQLLRSMVTVRSTAQSKFLLQRWVSKYRTNTTLTIIRRWIQKYVRNKMDIHLRNWIMCRK